MGKPKPVRQTPAKKATVSTIKKKNTRSLPSTSILQPPVDEFNDLNEEEEDPANYNCIGFMKIDLGEEIEGYTIIRKTGYGNFSTVWLGYDREKHKFAALKISRAKQEHVEAAHAEQSMLKHIGKIGTNHPGYDRVVHMLDKFDLTRSEKLHPCTVFEPLGSSLLSKIYKSKNGIELPAIQKIARQMLLALKYLHEECRLVHTDVKPENVLVTMTKKQMYEITQQVKDSNFVGTGYGCNLRSSERKPLRRTEIKKLKTLYSEICSHASEVDPAATAQCGQALPVIGEKSEEIEDWELEDSSDEENDNERNYRVIFRNLGYAFPVDKRGSTCLRFKDNDKRKKVYDEIMDPGVNIKIIDIGCALPINKLGHHHITTLEYRAPEVLSRTVVTEAVDIWSVGCVLFELATSEYLVHPKDESPGGVEEKLYDEMIACLGPIPEFLYRDGQKFKVYFDRTSGKYNKDVVPGKSTLTRLIEYGYTSAEVSLFNDLLLNILEYDPDKRYTAAQCLEHPFFDTPLS